MGKHGSVSPSLLIGLIFPVSFDPRCFRKHRRLDYRALQYALSDDLLFDLRRGPLGGSAHDPRRDLCVTNLFSLCRDACHADWLTRGFSHSQPLTASSTVARALPPRSIITRRSPFPKAARSGKQASVTRLPGQLPRSWTSLRSRFLTSSTHPSQQGPDPAPGHCDPECQPHSRHHARLQIRRRGGLLRAPE